MKEWASAIISAGFLGLRVWSYYDHAKELTEAEGGLQDALHQLEMRLYETERIAKFGTEEERDARAAEQSAERLANLKKRIDEWNANKAPENPEEVTT